jgi:metal transporter CNNM
MLIFSTALSHHGQLSLGAFIFAIVGLILASAVCSGLNISVMSLDLADLNRKAKLGNRQAKRILPLRTNTHLTLASILLTNVAAVSATTLVLNQRLSGWLAGIGATLLIVVFGEVLPQAIFSKSPLRYSSIFAPLLKFMSFVTYVISKPLQLLLDQLFPLEKAKLQSRHELGLMISEHLIDSTSELDNNEIEIMRGALGLSEKRARDIFTDIRHTYWLTPTTNLDAAKIDELKEKGFSRIPIFDEELTKVSDMSLYPAQLIGSMTALDTLFRKFITAGSHLVPIEKDDKIIGIATIEDLIEEIFGQEIQDETDRSSRFEKT